MTVIVSQLSGGRRAQAKIPARRALHNTLTRRWDEYDAYLFDIDGTLLHCRDAVHYYAFLYALKRLSGRELDLEGVTAHGNTDFGILRDALNCAGVADSTWRPRISEACSAMCRFVAERHEELDPVALPGTKRLLQHLRGRGALLGVATGNLEIVGHLKLKKAGLLDYFRLGAFSDDFEGREKVFSHGVTLVHDVLGEKAAICVFGDTPADIRAARACGVDVITVATGVHSLEELAVHGPNLCLASMRQLLAQRLDAGCDKAPQCFQTE